MMLKALVKDASMSAAMASDVVCTLENPTQTPAPAKGRLHRIGSAWVTSAIKCKWCLTCTCKAGQSKACVNRILNPFLVLTQDTEYDQVRPPVIAQQGDCIAENAVDGLDDPWQGFQSTPELQLHRIMHKHAGLRISERSATS